MDGFTKKMNKMLNEELLPFCACGQCGLRVTKPGNRFITGHNSRGRKLSQEHCASISKALKGRAISDDWREKISKTLTGRKMTLGQRAKVKEISNREKLPLSDNEKINYSTIKKNKNSATYLGCYIAEQVLSKVFKNVQVMPLNNPGYDFICGNGYKIDVKSCANENKYNWAFRIDNNQTPDYFLCIAFDNRDKLNPLHLWLIPGEDINHLSQITISKSRLVKWSKYEQSLDKILSCCDEMKLNHKEVIDVL